MTWRKSFAWYALISLSTGYVSARGDRNCDVTAVEWLPVVAQRVDAVHTRAQVRSEDSGYVLPANRSRLCLACLVFGRKLVAFDSSPECSPE